jgi:hypothetical protein
VNLVADLEQIRGFHDLLRQKPAYLFILLGWSSVSMASLHRAIHCRKKPQILHKIAIRSVNMNFVRTDALLLIRCNIHSQASCMNAKILRITGFLCFVPLSGILNTRKQRFGNWICFHPQVRGRRSRLCLVP